MISKNLAYFSNLPNQTKILTEPSLSNVTYYASGVAQSSKFPPSYINYDIESWNFTPVTEQSNPIKSIMTAANITHNGGILFSTSPTSAVLRNLYVNLDFTKIDMLIFQLTNLLNQGFLTNFTQSYDMISNYSEFYNPKIVNVPQIDLNMSANGVIQSLKTVQNSSVNTVALLWNPTISNTTLTQVLSYIKFGNTNGTKLNPYTISCNPPSESGSPFPLGITVVTCTATDNHGFNATKSFTVTVRDTTAPTILAPANLFVPQTGALTQISNLGSPIVHDLVDTSPKVTNNAPVNGFSHGTTNVTWTACDFSGNCANAVQQITVGQTTKIAMKSISLARWGQTITLTGTLTNGTGAPVVGRTITFSGTGVTNFPSAVTNSVGSFTASGKAPSTVAPGWTYHAYFGGDSNFLTSSSPIYTFATLKHHTSLIVSSNSVIVSSPTTFVATLVDTDSGKTGVAGETISYNGTGVIGVASQITNSSGIAIGTGTAPSTVGSDWTYEAVFAGDLLYLNSNSAIHSYRTT